jgi:hypothetical protein
MKPPPDYTELDPGIRNVVRFLWNHGYNTTDSGDGVTKGSYGETEPHVYMTLPSHCDICLEADKLKKLLEAHGTLPEDVRIETTYSPVDGHRLLMLHGLNDDTLAMCNYCEGEGDDPIVGRCPVCRPFCYICEGRWDRLKFDDCPICQPAFPTVEQRVQLNPSEHDFLSAMRLSVVTGVRYSRMLQFIAWEWMHQAPKEALIPSSFEPTSVLRRS